MKELLCAVFVVTRNGEKVAHKALKREMRRKNPFSCKTGIMSGIFFVA